MKKPTGVTDLLDIFCQDKEEQLAHITYTTTSFMKSPIKFIIELNNCTTFLNAKVWFAHIYPSKSTNLEFSSPLNVINYHPALPTTPRGCVSLLLLQWILFLLKDALLKTKCKASGVDKIALEFLMKGDDADWVIRLCDVSDTSPWAIHTFSWWYTIWGCDKENNIIMVAAGVSYTMAVDPPGGWWESHHGGHSAAGGAAWRPPQEAQFKNKPWRPGGKALPTVPRLPTISSTWEVSGTSRKQSGDETPSSPWDVAR